LKNAFARSHVFNPDAPERDRRPLRAPEPSVHEFEAADGTKLRLTRYRGGDKGPVLVAHGMASSSAMWTVDTIDTNMVEHLVDHGFDVWLFDWRSSIALDASRGAYTADEVAVHDFPAGVDFVRRQVQAESVQVVAHCIGSVTFHMAMLAGMEGVRSAVCLQVGTHIDVPALSSIKSHLYLPTFIKAIGIKSLTAYVDTHENWFGHVYDEALKLYPVEGEERCDNPVCRRICFEYGMLYEHDQLNQATHDNLHELFGITGMRIFEHLGTIQRAGHVVDSHGDNVYLPHLERLAIPISYIHGAENDCILPSSTETTVGLLRGRNGDMYTRHLIPLYGHVDCSFGKNAARDVYPRISEHLEAAGH
jgi:cholesterol oxidase